MTENTKSLIRHILTALGFVLGLLGLNQFTGIITYLTDSLDTLWASIIGIVGVATTIYGFFKGKPKSV